MCVTLLQMCSYYTLACSSTEAMPISTGKNFQTSMTRMLFLGWLQSHQNWTHISLLFNYGVRMSCVHPCLQVAAINPCVYVQGVLEYFMWQYT